MIFMYDLFIYNYRVNIFCLKKWRNANLEHKVFSDFQRDSKQSPLTSYLDVIKIRLTTHFT